MSIKNQLPIHSVNAVADYFLLKADYAAGDCITNLRMQKLCFFAQVWSVVATDSPIFDDRIEAWALGPVMPKLYRRFRKYKWQSIDPAEAKNKRFQRLAEAQLEILQQVWDVFSAMSPRQLVHLTHAHAPWQDAYGDRPSGRACDEEITIDAIRQFYGKKGTKWLQKGCPA